MDYSGSFGCNKRFFLFKINGRSSSSVNQIDPGEDEHATDNLVYEQGFIQEWDS